MAMQDALGGSTESALAVFNFNRMIMNARPQEGARGVGTVITSWGEEVASETQKIKHGEENYLVEWYKIGGFGEVIIYREKPFGIIEWFQSWVTTIDNREELGRIPYNAAGDPIDKEIALATAKRITSKDALEDYLKAAAQGVVEAPEKAIRIAFPTLAAIEGGINSAILAKEVGPKVANGTATREELLQLSLIGLTTTIVGMNLKRALGSAKNLGIDLSAVRIIDGKASVKVDFTHAIDMEDIASVIEYLKSQGVHELVLDTGAVVTSRLAGTIQKLIDKGRLFFGGTPRLVKVVPSILPGEPPVPYFEIHFDVK